MCVKMREGDRARQSITGRIKETWRNICVGPAVGGRESEGEHAEAMLYGRMTGGIEEVLELE